MIYHPLLYKTKMCEFYQKYGVCRKCGVYCGKAHNPSDICNLVIIYCQRWKSYGDLNLWESGTKWIIKSGDWFDKFSVLIHDVSLRNLCLKEKQGPVGTKSNMKKNRPVLLTIAGRVLRCFHHHHSLESPTTFMSKY